MEILLISRVLGEQGGAKDRQSQSFHKIQPFLVHTTFSLYNTHIWAWRESEAWTTFAQQRIVYRAIFQHSLQTNREMSTQQCSNTRKIRLKCILNQLESTAAHPLHGRLQTRSRHNPAGELTKTKEKKKDKKNALLFMAQAIKPIA